MGSYDCSSEQYRVFQSLIKPQPPLPKRNFVIKYRVFQSLIKPQRIMTLTMSLLKYRVFQSLIKPQQSCPHNLQ